MRLAAGLAALALAGCAGPAPPPPERMPPPPGGATPPPAFQYLYGSGEAAALSIQAWNGLVADVRERLEARRAHRVAIRLSAVLVPDASLASPRFVPCEDKPAAVVVDADETSLLNLGIEEKDARDPGKPFDAERWSRWEQSGAQAVAAVPGAVEAFAALRAAGVTMIVNSNRSAENAAGTAMTLAAAGLGEFVHGETLFLRGDADGVSGKDGRRAAIADKWCVLALAGDQLGDFSDQFNAGASVAQRRTLAALPAIRALWGDGWFMLPNPVYGTAVRGTFDDVFPAATRWRDPDERGAN